MMLIGHNYPRWRSKSSGLQEQAQRNFTDHSFQSKNLFPVQIENAMTAHPEIREAAAVAVPDDKYGEVVGAWVVREPHTTITREELRQRVARDINPQVS